ncbi:hypothetical protein G5C60_13425 [Streptomyces sp. HC44]|uniref:Uncharacterized protein n=1 Tax=Streptomyces scabichelini TaxID=2711217 RepID=A0A6G4V426_9ACTN|nr:hypothetical protein [Streptomyces scabichelini]NGO08594.1 hypothetical protein [Streptomyces scabichelini]
MSPRAAGCRAPTASRLAFSYLTGVLDDVQKVHEAQPEDVVTLSEVCSTPHWAALWNLDNAHRP